MSQDLWTAVDQYITNLFVPPDAALDATLRASAEAGLPLISVSPPQGKLLMLLAQTLGARRILEIGTLGGYSTIWLARALPPEGRLVTLELNPKHAEVARANVARAGLSALVDVKLGRASDTLAELVSQKSLPFDLIFIDADKPSIPDYFSWALRLSREGSLIVTDNVIRHGAVVDASSKDPNVQGVRRFNEIIAADVRVTTTQIQTVGSKGYDGFAISRVSASVER